MPQTVGGMAGAEEPLTFIGVLQELTVATFTLFDPAQPFDLFLQTAAARLGCRAALCLGVTEGRITLEGAAGLARASRELPLPPAPPTDREWESLALPYPELPRDLARWVFPIVERATRPEACRLVLFFDGEPVDAPVYRGLVMRIARTLAVALHHRQLYARLLESERSLRLQSEELEHRVDERTRELAVANAELQESLRRQRETQEQLIQAAKMAAVGTLVAGLSHELNNPVGVILGYVQGMLKRAPKDAAERPALEAIHRQAERAGNLIRSLLSFSRQRSGARERLLPRHLVEQAVVLAGPQAKRRDVRLVVTYEGDALPAITVSPEEIESALLNLVLNAIDATPPGTDVHLVAAACDREGVTGVEFSVRDLGPGIPPEVLPRIFDPFFTTKPVGQGTGLGLSLSRQIVEVHGGAIHVETAAGAGTTMRLWLPAAP